MAGSVAELHAKTGPPPDLPDCLGKSGINLDLAAWAEIPDLSGSLSHDFLCYLFEVDNCPVVAHLCNRGQQASTNGRETVTNAMREERYRSH